MVLWVGGCCCWGWAAAVVGGWCSADVTDRQILGVVGVAIGVVLLPELSRRVRAEDGPGARDAFCRAAEFAMALTLPAAAALVAMPGPIAEVLFARGAFSAEDAELLESRKLSNEDVARIFGVPGGAVGIRDSVSYGSAEADARALVQNCLQPLAERVEQALMRCLLTPEGRRQYAHDPTSVPGG